MAINKRIQIKCLQCGLIFDTYLSCKGRKKYCSKKCFYLAQSESWKTGKRLYTGKSGKDSPGYKERIKIKCIVCNDFFYMKPQYKDRKYCSQKCYGKWRSENIIGENHPNWKKRIKINCKQCNKEFKSLSYKNQRFCSKKCYWKWQSENTKGENANRWKGGIMHLRGGYKREEYKLWRKSVFERDSYRCLICGKVGGTLNAHHIKSWKDFPELRFDIDNGMTMCRQCHQLGRKDIPLFFINMPIEKNI